jgi:hypothetical protein
LVSSDEYNPSRRNRAQVAGLLTGVGLLEDAEPILRAEPPTLRLRRHFRIGVGRACRGGGTERCGRPPGSLRLRSHRHLHLLGCWHAIHPSNPPRPYINLNGKVVSPIIGIGGPYSVGCTARGQSRARGGHSRSKGLLTPSAPRFMTCK